MTEILNCPEETARNRQEIRAALAHPMFLQVLQAVETAQAASWVKPLAAINAFYDNELNVKAMSLAALADVSTSEESRLAEEYRQKTKKSSWTKGNENSLLLQMAEAVATADAGTQMLNGFRGAVVRRSLRDFPQGHQAVMRLAEILRVMGIMTDRDVLKAHLPMVWNEGKSEMSVPPVISNPMDRAAFNEMADMLVKTKFGTPESSAEIVQEKCRAMLKDEGVSPEIKAVLHRYLYSGTRWLDANDVRPLIPNGETATCLRLGRFADGRDLLYDRTESLVTVAPPGSGKSTAHVLRNLLYLNAPAVVLDIKGDMHAATVDWRREHVGTVYRFAPADRDNSLHFNPLDFISTEPEEAYEQSERLAELLTVPPEKEEYFDERAIQVIRGIVLYVAVTLQGKDRSMETVLDLLSSGDMDDPAAEGNHEDAFFALLARMSMSDIPSLRRMGNALLKMPSRQREGVFDSARTKLKVWESPAIARLTEDTTFRPELLRSERATLYLCVELGDIKRYASVLRVLLGTCIGHLCRGTPDPAAEVVTFFLDEMPRLRKMDVVEEALDVGRGYGVRLWMFAQNVGQLRTVYANADGMLGNCLAQCYMNPDAERSKWLESHLGRRRGLLDGHEKPLAEAAELTGTAFADKVVVLLNGMDNACVTKQPYYTDPVAMARAAAEPDTMAEVASA